ncbi:glutathione S-transferase domain-containing protein [Heterostelium album PN500]|uniref:Glutathione S-transferase domain-containing protein n=1 Tax=Heterostelium pallidum (strain ATCC 26659 / Pp 5 / PN500) TaxID=670386 RepID=D3BFK7_HETP5|nr:glutathione S-transferase domain-containing protein [Heterostelium album PN500]EFA79921.1 glutathione S-transferase domain-containing protein [Heterostelium album PN500]|eukprot:XP_020432041.1 glutathione S-transferase domain-containing protein [Heterostelium album PN500]
MESIIQTIVNNKVQVLTSTIVVLAGAKLLSSFFKKEPVYERDIVYIYDFPQSSMPVIHSSPFVLKVITFMRYANIPYKVINSMENGPRAKKPFIRYNGELVSDSQNIIEFLTEKFNVTSLKLKDEQQEAEAHLLRRYIDDAFYWSLVYSRWCDPVFSPVAVRGMLAGVPPMLFGIISRIAKSAVGKQLYNAGIGRCPREEIYSVAVKDVNSIAKRLGDSQFLFNDKLSVVDISLFSMLVQLYYAIEPTPISKAIKSNKNLVDYIERIQNIFKPCDFVCSSRSA